VAQLKSKVCINNSGFQKTGFCFSLLKQQHKAVQIIATSAQVTPNGRLLTGIPPKSGI